MSEISEFLNFVDKRDQKVYLDIVDFMKAQGYEIKRAKTKDVNYTFVDTKTKRQLLELSIDGFQPKVKLKFYANKNYSQMFEESVRYAVEEFHYQYTGCYRCGKCPGEKQGYTYIYEDGVKYFKCGKELVELVGFEASHYTELIELIRRQHDYYLETNSKV